MSLKQKINADYIAAFKAKDTIKKNTLSVLKTRITEEEKKQKVADLDDNAVLTVVGQLAKQRQQTIEIYRNASTIESQANLANELLELGILQEYLPTPLSDGEIIHILSELLLNGENMGGVMKHFKENYNGRYDSKSLSSQVNALLKARL